MPRTSYMEEFVMLAETLSFSRTAEVMHITQPALSRHIAALEEEMGGRLLERSTRHVELTEAGKIACEAFRRQLVDLAAAQSRVRSLTSGGRGSLSIGSPYYWTEEFTEPAVIEFRRQHPEYLVSIVSCQPEQAFEDLRIGRTDIAVLYHSDQVDDIIRAVPFAHERYAVICMNDDSLASLDEVRGEDLRGHPGPLVMLGGPFYQPLIGSTMDLLEELGAPPGRVAFTQQVDTLGITLKETGGYALLGRNIRHMDRSYLSAVPLEDEHLWPMALYYRLDNGNPLISQYINIALKVFERQR